MGEADCRDREIRALRERMSRLGEATLRINESLDLDTVLQGVLDSARDLTQARYGVITLLDDSGRPQDFLSSGFTQDESERLWGAAEGWQLFDYLHSVQGPLRVRDFRDHTRSMGVADFRSPVPLEPSLPFLASPVLHRGRQLGNIFLAGKESGEEFAPDDEETLVSFALQAAMVLANARRYREEQRARNDLETLINTSPVGVAVFDARTGTPLSFNRESLRIMDVLRTPGRPPDHLLEVLK